jgi:YggT family protein
MFVLANFECSCLCAEFVINIYMYIIIARPLFPVNPDPYNPIVRFLTGN